MLCAQRFLFADLRRAGIIQHLEFADPAKLVHPVGVMFFFEGLKALGPCPFDLSGALELAKFIDFYEPQFARSEPALKHCNFVCCLQEPDVPYRPAFKQDLSGLDFQPIVKLLLQLQELQEFSQSVFFACELNYLLPSSSLLNHFDVRWYHLYGRRIQIPLVCENSFFVSRNRFFPLKQGEMYELDNISFHRAVNDSQNVPKIALLIDFLDRKMFEGELASGRNLRRRVLYPLDPPEKDLYR